MNKLFDPTSWLSFVVPSLLAAIGFTATMAIAMSPREAPPPEPPKPAPGEIEGYYTVSGDAPGGRYSGVCCITRHGAGYVLVWAGPGLSSAGVGFRRGDVLSVAAGGNACCYTITADKDGRPRLDGEWVSPALGSRNVERMAWLRPLD